MNPYLLAISAAVGGALGNLLTAYFVEKGKNLATKEDIRNITQKIEEVKTEFARGLFEHQTRYAKLHERRADAIDGLYRALVRTVVAFDGWFLLDANAELREAEKKPQVSFSRSSTKTGSISTSSLWITSVSCSDP